MNDSVREILRSQEKLKKLTNGLKAEIAEVNKQWDEKKSQIIEDIQRALPYSKLYIFGSRFTGLATKDSDCDIYIDFDGRSYSSELSREEQSRALEDMKIVFKSSGYQLRFLPRASVPLLTILHERTKISCDISCKSGLPVENSKLLRQLLTSDYRVSWLVLTVKWWMKTNDLFGTNKFTSYTTTWLVLFFLMCREPCVLRPVIDMKRGCSRQFIGHWDCSFSTSNQLRTANSESRFMLLAHFFRFYSQMNFNQVVLCPLTARRIPREQFETLSLPSDYQSYVTVKRMNPDKRLATEKALCLQDPLELSNNIAKDVMKKDLDKFKFFCDDSYMMLQHLST